MPAPTVSTRLSPAEVDEVRALVDAVEDADGAPPLSEHVLLHLPHGGDADVRHLLVRSSDPAGAGPLVGYAHLDVTDPVQGSSAELAVLPSARGRGTGHALVTALLDLAPDERLRLWAHGEHPAAARLASQAGFARSRVLWQMRMPLAGADLPEPRVPDGVVVRTFRVGQDEDAWTALNARAFADHPDQGSWSGEEVLLREAEPWFDPEGFFLAERDGTLVGFHWTKVHGGRTQDDGVGGSHSHDPVGEVYVVGVDPSQQGQGLGPALTLLGLRHLQARGLPEVMLYVDEGNTNAVRVYERLGFRRSATDVCFSR
ncbi:MAG: mycothiol synthase [Frankiales bacterium]|nr:mycothiol synthase [Frankiales bacterium]